MTNINVEHFKCPTCEGYIPNSVTIGAYMGAISRHGHGEVCSACGTREALEDYIAQKSGIPADSDWFKNHVQVIV